MKILLNTSVYYYSLAPWVGDIGIKRLTEEKSWIAQYAMAWEVLQAQKANSNVKQMAKNRN